MLARARAREVYATLDKAELTQYLHDNPDAFDLIVSADTLVYFGVLDAALTGAHRALRDGGLVIFTVEEATPEHAPEGHRLNPHGRYSHTQDYVERTLAAAGFARWTIGHDVLRQERGEPVPGLIVTAYKGGTRPDDAHAVSGRTA
jgi:predicted TPR repeat methyltransferase